MSFVCDLCDYSTTKKYNLKQHLNKVNKCENKKLCEKTREQIIKDLYPEDTKTHVCICNKKYTQSCSLYRHRKECDLYQNEKIKMNESKTQEPVTTHNTINSTVTNSLNTNSTVNSHNTIIINNFGSENLSYLTPEFLEKCTCVLPLGIKSMVKAIHLNIDHPENHNVKITNIKSPLMHVIENDEWTLKDKKHTLKTLIEKVSDIQKCFFEDNKKGITDRWNSYKRDAIEFYHEKLENEDKELWQRLMKEIYLLFCNHKEMFPAKRKRKPKQKDDNIVL
jgi:hypothetical protein